MRVLQIRRKHIFLVYLRIYRHLSKDEESKMGRLLASGELHCVNQKLFTIIQRHSTLPQAGPQYRSYYSSRIKVKEEERAFS